MNKQDTNNRGGLGSEKLNFNNSMDNELRSKEQFSKILGRLSKHTQEAKDINVHEVNEHKADIYKEEAKDISIHNEEVKFKDFIQNITPYSMEDTYTKAQTTSIATHKEEYLEILDENFKAAVNKSLHRPIDNEITKKDALSLNNRLDLSDSNIVDISPIKYFSNVSELYLSDNNISDLNCLSDIKMPNLEILSIKNNQIQDATPLKTSYLPNLKNLVLSNNNIKDLSFVSNPNFKNLEILNLSNNKIDDIKPIADVNLLRLKGVSLENNEILEIGDLKDCNFKSLIAMYLSGQNITLKPHFTNKKRAEVENPIKDLSGDYIELFNISDNGKYIDGKIVWDHLTEGKYTFTAEFKKVLKLNSVLTLCSGTITIPVIVDFTNPILEISFNEAWTNEPVKINIKEQDTLSGIKVNENDGDLVHLREYVYSVDKNGSYDFISKDNAGNETVKTIEINNIDLTPPIFTYDITTEHGLKKDVHIVNVTVCDLGSGLKETVLPNGHTVKKDEFEYIISEDGEYKFITYDMAGNYLETVIEIGDKKEVQEEMEDTIKQVIEAKEVNNTCDIEVTKDDNHQDETEFKKQDDLLELYKKIGLDINLDTVDTSTEEHLDVDKTFSEFITDNYEKIGTCEEVINEKPYNENSDEEPLNVLVSEEISNEDTLIDNKVVSEEISNEDTLIDNKVVSEEIPNKLIDEDVNSDIANNNQKEDLINLHEDNNYDEHKNYYEELTRNKLQDQVDNLYNDITTNGILEDEDKVSTDKLTVDDLLEQLLDSIVNKNAADNTNLPLAQRKMIIEKLKDLISQEINELYNTNVLNGDKKELLDNSMSNETLNETEIYLKSNPRLDDIRLSKEDVDNITLDIESAKAESIINRHKKYSENNRDIKWEWTCDKECSQQSKESKFDEEAMFEKLKDVANKAKKSFKDDWTKYLFILVPCLFVLVLLFGRSKRR